MRSADAFISELLLASRLTIISHDREPIIGTANFEAVPSVNFKGARLPYFYFDKDDQSTQGL